MVCSQFDLKNNHGWCKLWAAHTNGQFCGLCLRRGQDHIGVVFARRDHKAIPVAPKKARGAGDTVAKAIHTVSRGRIKPCGGCKKRQKKLNEIVPYNKARKLVQWLLLLLYSIQEN